MTVRAKAHAAIWAILGLLAFTLLVFRISFLVRSAELADKQEIARSTVLALKLLEKELHELDRVAVDYASWNDTYEFMLNRETAFLDSNFQDSTFSSNRLSLAILADTEGGPVFVSTFDLERGLRYPSDEEVVQRLLEDQGLLRRANSNGGVTGLWIMGDAPMLLAYRPILKSDLTGPPHGTLVFGRCVDSELLAGLNDLLGKRVEIVRLDNPSLPQALQHAIQTATALAEPVVELRDEYSAVGFGLLWDGNANASCVLKCEGVRADKESFYYTAALVAGTLLAGLVISGLASLVLLDQLVFKRLTRLRDFVADVRERRDYSLRAEEKGGDEIYELATVFNGLLESLQVNLAERARASLALEANEARHRALLQHSSDIIALLDKSGATVYVSPSVQRILGRAPEALLGKRLTELVYADEKKACENVFRRVVARKDMALAVEFRARHADGTLHWIEAVAQNLLDHPSVDAVLVTLRDISERKRTNQYLAESERRLREVAARTGQLVYDYDSTSDFIVWAGAIEQIAGVTGSECTGIDFCAWEKMIHPDDLERVREAHGRAEVGGDAYRIEYRLLRADGTEILVEDNGTALAGLTEAGPRYLGAITDISRERAREEALLESRYALRTLLDNTYDAVIMHDHEGKVIEVNEKMLRMYGITREQALQCTIKDLSSKQDADEESRKVWADVIAGQPTLDVEVYLTPITMRGGKYILGSVRDLTEIREAQRAAHESELRFREMLERISLLAMTLDANGRLLFCNDAFVALTGWSRAELLGSDYYLKVVAPEEREAALEMYDRCIQDGKVLSNLQHTIVTKSGARRQIVWDTTHLRNNDGVRIGIAAIGRDVTDHRKLEEQYRQAQKMEAVGQLAGGVAHDFNNLLQVITGYVEMTLSDMPRSNETYAMMEEVQKASSRATTLVRQLLTFSRRESMTLTRVDLNAVIANIVKLLRRVIGEHIVLETVSHQELPSVQADTGQLEQVLMNLCVNARDAMPLGGRIRIETKSVRLEPEYTQVHPWASEGPYVLLEVADTGDGMSKEVQEHIFEPFFTTKGTGKGTGLGLATVYGIVKQHSGFIQVYSELGQGTVFRVYLPAREGAPLQEKSEERGPAVALGGTETILLAEDEQQVRRLASQVLQNAGYTVILAKDGEEAVDLFKTNKDAIALCLLDVVMPKMSGRAAYDAIKAINPQTKVLFCSGYSFGMLEPDQLPDTHFEVIQKPFSPGILLRRIRTTIDSRQSE
ncbi:MAG: PAS domain S-box protein [Candidatus Hydrogenedentales bacterium]|jgi:PAS domain S-box-containing protein